MFPNPWEPHLSARRKKVFSRFTAILQKNWVLLLTPTPVDSCGHILQELQLKMMCADLARLNLAWLGRNLDFDALEMSCFV